MNAELVFFLKEGVEVEVISASRNHIYVKVSFLHQAHSFYLSLIYGFSEASNKILTWDLIHTLCPGPGLFWMCVRDFKEILCPDDKNGGNEANINLIAWFRMVLEQCRLVDLGFDGY